MSDAMFNTHTHSFSQHSSYFKRCVFLTCLLKADFPSLIAHRNNVQQLHSTDSIWNSWFFESSFVFFLRLNFCCYRHHSCAGSILSFIFLLHALDCMYEQSKYREKFREKLNWKFENRISIDFLLDLIQFDQTRIHLFIQCAER